MKPILLVTIILAIAAACCTADEATAPKPDENAYVFDSVTFDTIEQWQPIGRTTIELSWMRKDDPYFGIKATFAIRKVGQMVHGIQRRGLGLPLPRAVRFWVYAEVPYLWVVLGDKAGNQVCSRVPLAGISEDAWSQVTIPLAETAPFGAGAAPVNDLDSIAILTHESAGEYDAPSPYRVYFGHFEAVYAPGIGPTNPIFTQADLEAMIQPLDGAIQRVETLIEQARAAGAETRYALVSLTVLKRYRGEVSSMLEPSDPFIAKRAAQFLLDCAARTERDLAGLIAHPSSLPRVPDISLHNLRPREGSFFSGDRPVMLAGVCGWFNRGYFDQIAPTGFTCLGIEIGPASTVPEEGRTNPGALAGIKEVLDTAAEHNMVCDLLLSPHYFPGWAREKWPSTDATGWRQQTNGFMPWTITDPHVRDVIAQHLAVTIPQVRDRPALLSYDLVNEAWYRLMPDFPTSQWQAFRRARPELDEWQALSLLTQQNVTDFIKWYVAEVHKYDTRHPIEMKTIDTEEVMSIDREAVGDVFTANGMDAMPSWPDWRRRLAADFAWPFLRHDFHRSLTADKPIQDDEYHISGGTYPLPASYVRAALWGLALHGRDSTACWVYDRVDSVSIYWHPEGVEALGQTALDFLRLGPEIHAFQRQRGSLAIYYGGAGMTEAYLACLFQDLDVGVVTDKRIQQGRLDDYKVLVLPADCSTEKETQRRIEAFRKAGGVVVECPKCVEAEDLWPLVRAAVVKAQLTKHVAVDRWGIECRSIESNGRRLLYLLNHRRDAVEVSLRSQWPLQGAVDLRTERPADARRVRLEPLEVRLFEVK